MIWHRSRPRANFATEKKVLVDRSECLSKSARKSPARAFEIETIAHALINSKKTQQRRASQTCSNSEPAERVTCWCIRLWGLVVVKTLA